MSCGGRSGIVDNDRGVAVLAGEYGKLVMGPDDWMSSPPIRSDAVSILENGSAVLPPAGVVAARLDSIGVARPRLDGPGP